MARTESLRRPGRKHSGAAVVLVISLAGQAWVGIGRATLGRSVRAKVPIFDGTGQVSGIGSVGLLEDQVNATLWQSMPLRAANIALALGLRIAGSVLVSRRLGRQTF